VRDSRERESPLGNTWRRSALGVVLGLAVVSTACSSDDPSPTPAADSSSATTPGTVDVTLQEFAIGTSVTSAPAGSVTFDASNEGPDDDHEFVIIKTDLGLTELPTNPDGSVDEEGAGIEAIDEIAEFPPGETATLTVDLDAGNYVFICNVYDEADQESHYQEGMRAAFVVE
jgi:uncharacterized cupredoxin-like copper-binding protein